MRYCLSVAIHTMYFYLAIVNDKHEIVNIKTCNYDTNKDIARNIYLAYDKYFNDYCIEFIGVAISNSINNKNGYIIDLDFLNIKRYNLKTSLNKLFNKDIYIYQETDLSALTFANNHECEYMLYLNLDNRISNSFIKDQELVNLDDSIDISKSYSICNCYKDNLKKEGLKKDLDDEYVGGYFLSNDKSCISIIKNWTFNLTKEINRIIIGLPIKEIVFAGYLGEYFDEFKKYISLPNDVICYCDKDRKTNALIGISHLIFKDN